MESSQTQTVVLLTFLITMVVTVVACELNMTALSQTTPIGSSSVLFDCDSSTCAEFTGRGYTDQLVWPPQPLAWLSTFSLIGTNLLCGAHAHGRLYVVPSSTLEPMGLMSTCRLISVSNEGQLDVCTFSCQNTSEASQNTALEALRVIRRPFQPSHGDWTLCGLDVDLTSTIVNISVSTEQPLTNLRDRVLDGNVTEQNGWSAASYTTPKWLRVNFDKVKVVSRVDILARCRPNRQAKGYDLMYANGDSKVTRSCSTMSDCSDIEWERYHLSLVRTSYLTISASTFCDKAYYYGIRELKIWGF